MYEIFSLNTYIQSRLKIFEISFPMSYCWLIFMQQKLSLNCKILIESVLVCQ